MLIGYLIGVFITIMIVGSTMPETYYNDEFETLVVSLLWPVVFAFCIVWVAVLLVKAMLGRG